MIDIKFRKITQIDVPTIFRWLAESHITATWDNSQAHKDDILNFVEGRKTPSSYADGKYVYWTAMDGERPYALIMSIQESLEEDIDQIKLSNLSKTGHSYGIEYMIGDINYFGKGYGASTLAQFVDFFRVGVDQKADTFLIDPAADNPKAKHVYLKAGFEYIGDFVMSGDVSGTGKLHHLLIKRF